MTVTHVLYAVGGINMTPKLQQEYNELKREADEQAFDEVSSLKKEQELLSTAKDQEKLLSENVEEMQKEEARLEKEIKEVRVSCPLLSCCMIMKRLFGAYLF